MFNKENHTIERNLTKEQVIANKFITGFNNGKYPDLVLTIENISKIKAQFEKSWGKLAPVGYSFDEKTINLIIDLLKKQDIIKPSPKPEKIVEKKEEEIYKTDFEKNVEVMGVTQSEITEEQLRVIEANLLYEEIHSRKIFKDSEELDKIYERTSNLTKSKEPETIEYYNEFVRQGLVEPEGQYSAEEVVERDFNSIKEKNSIFAKDAPRDPALYKKYVEAKKIATVVERCLSYCCTDGGWYGEKLRIVLASLFDDIRRGVDEVLLIEKDNDSHDVLGLGVDATFRGIKSELFKKKFFTLLQSIRNGYKTKIKYFKDHNGKMSKEFSVPKIILYFDINDVKELFDIIKDIDNNEEDKIKNSYLKSKIINQVINSCTMLADFSKESQNNIFRDYQNINNSIIELSWENKELRDFIDTDQYDENSKKLQKLVEEFKDLEKLNLGN
jgi:hypothetical protein